MRFLCSITLALFVALQGGVAAAETPDFDKAKQFAEQGDAWAQYFLGLMYAEGQGVPQDFKEAVRWYQLAAEQDVAAAQNNLGTMYTQGQGIPQDFKEAVKWCRLAAEQGEASAQYNLGFLYYHGQGVSQDYTFAHMWFNIAAANGYVVASKDRDLLAKKMTAASISKAQEMARVCMGSDYRDCGAK